MKNILCQLCTLSVLTILLAACDSTPASDNSTTKTTTAAGQTKVKAMGTIMAQPAEVWNTISVFSEPEQYMAPMIKSSNAKGSGIGMTRSLQTATGAAITEKLTALDGSAMSLSYAATESSLPMDDYQASIRVKDLGNGNCQVFWEGSFNTAAGGNEQQLKVALTDTYVRSIFGLKRLHMATTTVKGKIDKPVDEVWKVISDFEGVERYLPMIEASKTIGKGKGARRFATSQAGEFSEELIELDKQQHYLRYEGLDSDWPMAGYEAEMQLTSISDQQCELRWTAVYKPLGDTAEKVDGLIRDMFEQGIEGLKQL